MRLLAHDLREATRTLRKEPRFLLITSLTLALGIAAATSIFSVVNGVLLRPLPYPNADRLVNVWSTAPGLDYPQFPLSPDLFLFFKKHNSVFEDMALFQNRRVNITESGPPEVIAASVATHSYFTTLGIAFSLGRGYGAQEDRPDGPSVAVISHRLWARRYGADQALVGRTIRIDGAPTEVLGVAPAWLDQDGSPDVWLPARFDLANPPAGTFGWNATARLKPGVLPDQAATHLLPLVKRAMEQVQTEHYRAFLRDGGYRPLVHPMLEDLVGSLREPLWILLGTVVVVLLVACGNVANLCLVRADGRQREMAVRVALGASRGSLTRKLLAEALVISAIGSLIGVTLAAAALAGAAERRAAVDSATRADPARRPRRRVRACRVAALRAPLRRRAGAAIHAAGHAGGAASRRPQRDRRRITPSRTAPARRRANRCRARAAGRRRVAGPQLRAAHGRGAGLQAAVTC